MAKSFQEVYDLYRANSDRLGDMSLQDFSRVANYVTNSDEFSSGDTGLFGGAVKRGSYWLNRGIEATGLPEAFGSAGENIFEAFGADPTVGRQVGEELPRGLANFLPLMLAAPVAAAVGAPAALATGAGLAATSALSAAGAFEADAPTRDIVAAGLAPAAGLGAMAVARPFVSRAVGALSRVPGAAAAGFRGPTTVTAPATAAQAAASGGIVAEGAPVATTALRTVPERLTAYVGDNLAAIAGVEATQVALTDKKLGDVFTKENILANVAGTIPFAVLDIPALAGPRVLDVQPVLQPRIGVAKTDPSSELFAQRVTDYTQRSQELKNIKDKGERQLARVRLAEEYADILQDPQFTLVNKVKKEEIAKVAVENPQKVLEQVTKELASLRAEITNLRSSENVEGFVATANALKETPIPQVEVTQLMEAQIAKGDTPGEAAAAVANTILNKVAADPVQATTMRKQVAAEVLKARAAGGARGGRPAGQTARNAERADWADNWFKTTPEGQEALKVFEAEYLAAEKRIPKGMPEEVKLDIRTRMINAVGAWRDKVLNVEGWATGKDKLAGYLRQTARDAWQPRASTEKFVDDKGIQVKFDSLDSAKAKADELNAKLKADAGKDEPPTLWMARKLTRKTKDGKSQWRLQSVQNIRKISVDAEGAPELAAPESTSAPVFQNMLDALSDKTGKALEPLRANDTTGAVAALEQAHALGQIKTPQDVQMFLSKITKLRDTKNTVIEVVLPKELDDAFVGPPEPAKPVAVEGTTPAERLAARKAAQAEAMAEAKERAKASAAVKKVLETKSDDPDVQAVDRVILDEAIKFVKDITFEDLASIIQKTPLMRSVIRQRIEAGIERTPENIVKIIEETMLDPSQAATVFDFVAEVQVAKSLKAKREAQAGGVKPLKPTPVADAQKAVRTAETVLKSSEETATELRARLKASKEDSEKASIQQELATIEQDIATQKAEVEAARAAVKAAVEEGPAVSLPVNATPDQMLQAASKVLTDEIAKLPNPGAWTADMIAEAQQYFASGRDDVFKLLKKPQQDRVKRIYNQMQQAAAGGSEFRPLLAGRNAWLYPDTTFTKALQAAGPAKNWFDLPGSERDRIWKDTGWLLGPDGKWRFEIDDTKAYLTTEFNDAFRFLMARPDAKANTTLSKLLIHPEFYKQYPDAKQLLVEFYNNPNDKSLGMFNSGLIKLNMARLANEQAGLSTLLHEVQHYVQDAEGFATGGSPDWVNRNSSIYNDEVASLVNAGMDVGLAKERAAYNLYRRLFGEVEAREVQQRRNFTQEELKLVTPFGAMSGDTWFVVPGKGTKFSIDIGGPMEPMQFSLESLTRGVLEQSGWTGEAIEKVAMPLVKRLKEVLPLDGVQFGRLINDALIGGQELIGMSSINGLARKVYLGVAKDFAARGQNEQLAAWTLNLAHEIGHNIEQAALNGTLSPEAMQTRQGFRTWALENQGDWTRTLTEFVETLPPSIRNIRELQEMLQPKNVEEFEASAHAIWAMGEVVKKADLELFAAVSPTPVRDWFRSLAKWGRDLVGAVKGALFRAPTEAGKLNTEGVRRLTDYYQRIKEATNEAYVRMAESSEVLGMDSQGLSPIRTSELTLTEDGVLRLGDQLARPNMVGPAPRGTMQKISDFASNSLVYLEQLAARYPRIAGLSYAVMNAPSTQKGFMSSAMEPIFGRYDPATGRTEIDPARKPLLKLLSNGGRVERVVSDIYRWQNKNRMEFPLQAPASASPMLAQRLSVLTPQERAAVQLWQAGQKRSLQVVNDNIVRMKASDGLHAVATALREMTPDKDALAIVTKALNAERTQDPAVKQQMIAEWAAELSVGDPVRDMANRNFVQQMVTELNGSVVKLQQNLNSRPWYTPEIRTGNYLLRSYDANGKQVSVDGYSTDAELTALKENAKNNGAVRFESKKRDRRYDIDLGDNMTSLLTTLDNTLVRKLQDVLPPNLAGNAQQYVDYLNLNGELTRLSQAHMANPTLPVRRLAEGRENLNMVSGWQHYVNTMGRVLSNRLAQAKMRYELSAPELKSGEYAPQIEQVRRTFENYLTPDSDFAKELTRWNAVYHLGFNIPTHIAELSQGLSTMLPELVFETGSITKGVKMLAQVGKELAGFYAKKTGGKLMGKDEWTHWGNLKEREMLEILARRGRMDNHAFLENLGDDVSSNLSLGAQAQRNLVGETLNIAGAPLKAFSDVSMNLYGSFTRWNSRMAAILGYRLARERGQSHVQAIEAADRFLVQTTFTSGRAGRPPEFYKNSNVGAMLYSLQRYALNWMSMYATHLKGAFADPKTLMDQQRGTRRQHAKALATMSLVQFGLAGALGMPFVSPLLTLLEDRLGLDVRGRAYKTLSDMLDDDADGGGYMADAVMRGSLNAMLERAGLPVDFGSRFNLSGLPGMNEFNGFDPGRVFGPTANIANSAFTGVSGMLTGNYDALAKSVAPVGLRKAIEYAVHGDAMTTKGTKLGLSDDEGLLYAFGLTPRRVSKTRDAERILENQRQERLAKTNKAADEIAKLLQSDPVAARQKFSEFVSDGLDAGMLQRDVRNKQREFARQVAEAAVKQTFPKDVRRTVAAPDRQQASETLRAMGAQFPAPTGVLEAQLASQVMRQLGQPAGGTRLAQARQRDRMLEQLTAWD